MLKTTVLSAIVGMALCLGVAQGADAPALKCPVSGQPASKDHALAYKKGEVYFCCDKCPTAFKENMKKFAAKANEQLVTSGQYKEVKCPFTGKALNAETAVEVDGVSVQFCCANCKAKFEKAKTNRQRNMVFGDKAFDKGFDKVASTDAKK
jgi:YHS domain-containing protein